MPIILWFPIIFWILFPIITTYHCWCSKKYTIQEKLLFSLGFLVTLIFFNFLPLVYAKRNYSDTSKTLLTIGVAISSFLLLFFFIVLAAADGA